jgi:hypothetical protein
MLNKLQFASGTSKKALIGILVNEKIPLMTSSELMTAARAWWPNRHKPVSVLFKPASTGNGGGSPSSSSFPENNDTDNGDDPDVKRLKGRRLR